MTANVIRDPSKGSQSPDRLRGGHVLAVFLGFFFVIFAVNGYFLFAALSTHSGVVAIEPYRKGLAYNDRIAADERQTALGWSDAVQVERNGRVVLTMRDRTGAPVSGLRVLAAVSRPSSAGRDHSVLLSEIAEGRYEADIGMLDEGNWIAAVEAREPTSAEPVFRSRRRLWLKP